MSDAFDRLVPSGNIMVHLADRDGAFEDDEDTCPDCKCLDCRCDRDYEVAADK